jgi:hypothetical protein
MVEQWFGVLTRRLLRRGEFTSRDDLEAKITAFTIPVQQERTALQVELGRRRRPRSLSRPAPLAGHQPPGRRMIITHG